MSKEFQWTPELKIEFLDWILNEETPDPTKELVRRFIESKQPKPEWEIIQYTYPSGSTLPDYNHKLAASRNYPIHTVKRLSDNTSWAIGDKFLGNGGCELTIKKFTASGEGMEVWSVEYGYWLLCDIKKVPAFITEDGCQVYENDKVWLLSTDRWHTVSAKAPKSPFRGDKEQFKYFSTKEVAEEYIVNHKPCFSLFEVISIYDKSRTGPLYTQALRSLAQSKITHKLTING